MLVEARCKKVLKNLVLKIYQDNLSIEYVMNYFDKNKDNQLDEQEFHELVKSMDPQISHNESLYLFKMFDSDHSGTIQTSEFKALINDRLSKIADKYFSKVHSNNPTQQLKTLIKRNNLNLQYIMQKFDLDNNKVLDINEFGMFVRSLDSRVNNQTITNMFNCLDTHR